MKIILREWKDDDKVLLAQLANNKLIADNLRDHFPYPYSLKDAEEWIALNKNSMAVTNYAIEADGELAGGCGVFLKEDVYRCSAEVGYWLGQPFWGKGIGTEAVRLLLEKITANYPAIIRIYAEVFEHNNVSMKVLEKNGFQSESIRKNAVVKNNTIINDHVWVKLIG